MYSTPMMMTQQFRFCPNPFRIDMYKGCDFGCKYCFANNNIAYGHDGFGEADIKIIEKDFKRAFESDEESKDITIELLRHRVPLHCGGMSDPFQRREYKFGLTYKLIELSVKYNYPITFSTKTCEIPEKYFEILDPNIHAFQVSIMGWNDEFIKKYETNTPTARERLNFIQNLRNRGFWCSIRIQPLVDLHEAELLVEHAGSIPNYITVEHLKIPVLNEEAKMLFKDEYAKHKFVRSDENSFNIELTTKQKEKNIARIKEIANANGVKVGVGDNDLHHLSQSRCCCGVDGINENFSNYLKYNLTYLTTGEYNLSDIWIPQSNCREIFYSGVCAGKKVLTFKEMTDNYIDKHKKLCSRAGAEKLLIEILGVKKRKLF